MGALELRVGDDCGGGGRLEHGVRRRWAALPRPRRGGDVLGFTARGVAGAVAGGRVRHEAAVCLAFIGVWQHAPYPLV